jgi:hypothetical protein
VDEAANGLFGVPSGAGTGPVFTGTAAGALALVLAGAVKTAAIWE